MRVRSWMGAVALAAWLGTSSAQAFCGFYVSGAQAKLYNNATQVVLLRDGIRTVLSMQNNYQGPPEDFAMVVPVPIVLQKDNVKTLPRDVFDRVDQLSAPRLVEYWEQDPVLRRSCLPSISEGKDYETGRLCGPPLTRLAGPLPTCFHAPEPASAPALGALGFAS